VLQGHGGLPQYGERDAETLAFVRRMQDLGFTQKEVRELVKLRGTRSQPCAPVRGHLEAKLGTQRQTPGIHLTRTRAPISAVSTRNDAGGKLVNGPVQNETRKDLCPTAAL
jgi:DNA-binding transcriptional MerR regulator